MVFSIEKEQTLEVTLNQNSSEACCASRAQANKSEVIENYGSCGSNFSVHQEELLLRFNLFVNCILVALLSEFESYL